MQEPESTPVTPSPQLAEKVRNGEYFREVMGAYHILYHDPMVERYLYIIITSISLLILLITLLAADAFLPLKREVPFIYKIQDVVEDLPRIQRLGVRGQDTNYLLKRFLLSNYVNLRESYDVQMLERNANGVRTQSTPEVFEEYQKQMDPRNPLSPIALFQRLSYRRIEVISVVPSEGQENEMDVVYDETVEGRERKKSRMIANISFRFSNIQIDQETGKFTPLEFWVTGYHTRRLQDL